MQRVLSLLLMLASSPTHSADAHAATDAHAHAATDNHAHAGADAPEATKLTLPPLPEGVDELRFQDLFKPIGRYGLELTSRVRELDGKRVRVLGYMVLRDDPPPGTMLLTKNPVHLHEHEYGLADDLPAATLWVEVPGPAGAKVPFTPGPLLLTGTLRVGPKAESDGRTSQMRLILDAREPVARDCRDAAAVPTAAPTASIPSSDIKE